MAQGWILSASRREFVRCTELVRENTDAPIVKSGEVWNLLGVQLTQHQKSAAAKIQKWCMVSTRSILWLLVTAQFRSVAQSCLTL